MSRLYDFLYADTGVVKNFKNCHDVDILDRYSETALRTSLPLLNSLKLNLKNIKNLHKEIYKDLFVTAGKTKGDLEIDGESNKDFDVITNHFDKNWLKENTSGVDVDGSLFSKEMAELLVFGATSNPFLYGSLNTFCIYANFVAKVNGIDIDFTKLSKVKEIASDTKNIFEMAKIINNAMQPLSLEETNNYRKHFGLNELNETKIICKEEFNKNNGFVLSSKGKTCDKTFIVNNQETEKIVSAISDNAEAIIHLEHYTKDKNTGWRKTDKIINEENKETRVIYDLNKFGEEEAVKTIVENDKTTKEFNHRNGICTTQLSNYKDVFIQTNFQGNEIIRTSPNILTKIDLKTLNEISDNGKNLSAIRDKYIIHKVNDDKLATITDVRKNGRNFEAIINYDNENYLVKDFGVQKGLFKFYELDNKINDATFEDHDRHEIYSSMRGMEMD